MDWDCFFIGYAAGVGCFFAFMVFWDWYLHRKYYCNNARGDSMTQWKAFTKELNEHLRQENK